jgi:hypothetical protein
VLIRHLWQLKTIAFFHRCLICAVLISTLTQHFSKSEHDSIKAKVKYFKDADKTQTQTEAKQPSSIGYEAQERGVLIPNHLCVERIVDEDLQNGQIGFCVLVEKVRDLGPML